MSCSCMNQLIILAIVFVSLLPALVYGRARRSNSQSDSRPVGVT